MQRQKQQCLQKLLCIITFLLLTPLGVTAQNVIKGHVTDEQGEDVIGATVVEKGNTGNVAITDFDGNFQIKVEGRNKKLVITYIGMQTLTVDAVPGITMNLKMKEEGHTLAEVQVVSVGYGNARRKDLTGSISSVGEGTLQHIQSTSAAEALAGRLAGVQVITSEGSPGASVSIKVRGGGSITQSNEPLYLVDGFRVDNIDDIPPSDIANIDVLKDAASTAIYGSEGANGVVMVTTKSGRIGKTEISFNATLGFNKFYNKTAVLSPYEYVYYQRELQPDKDDYYGAFHDIDIYKSMEGTDWQQKLFDHTGVKQNYNLNINGGTKELTYSISYSHDDETYTLNTSQFRRDNVNIKLKKTLFDKLTFDINAKLTNRIIDGPSVSNGQKLIHAIKYPPISTLQALLDEEAAGDEGLMVMDQLTNLTNPVYNLNNEYQKQKKFYNAYIAGVTWDINKGLSLRAEGSYGFNFDRTDHIYLQKTGESKRLGGQPVAYRYRWDGEAWTLRSTLTYKKRIKKIHNLNMMIGAEARNSQQNSQTVNSNYFPIDYTAEDILAMWNDGTPEPTYTNISEPQRTASFFGRANYVFDDKYYVNFTLRADGKNVFAPGRKWGVFPAAALAWRITDEKFMAKTRGWLDNLKLRLSYGVSGNARVNAYWRQEYSAITSSTSLYYQNEIAQSALIPASVLRNEKLTWESKHSFNTGADVNLFGNRITMTIDYYHDVTKNLILNVQLPSNSGYTSQYQNVGQTTNHGLELTLNTHLINNKTFYLDFNFNIAFNKNKVDKLYGDSNSIILSGGGIDIGSDNYRVIVGEPVGLMWGYVCDGIYSFNDFTFNNDTKRWEIKPGVADCSAILSKSGDYFGPGHIKLKDLNGDGIIDADNDRTIIGHAQPKHTGGFGFNAGYKGFDLTALFNWSYGNDVLNMSKLDYSSYNNTRRYQNVSAEMSLDKRFTTIDPSTGKNIYYGDYANPELLQQINQGKTMWHPMENNIIMTDWAVEDGSFLRLGTLSLGYTFPVKLVNKFSAKKVRVYITGTNLFCITGYSGQDPEVNTSSNALILGYDRSAYPKSRSYQFGLNVTF